MRGVDIDLLKRSAGDATRYLKALANNSRLLIMCHLLDEELPVGELEKRLGLRQPTLSQQLARLRAAGLVKTRRDSKSIYYSLADDDIKNVLEVLYGKFCVPRQAVATAPARKRRL